ncbi:probable serine carboxypeptidase CPVL isoform X1 [Haliotis cracherodii]|uniref:probable serine carboxypeptidase CPVL isoform X1 n=1 Tax=Haliotis cracherodii TaxID=6455 RepID=UPI0039E78173
MKFSMLEVLFIMASVAAARQLDYFRSMFPKPYPHALNKGVDPGQPLLLTPYIERGDIEKARLVSETGSYIPQPGHSGFLTVNKTTNSNMFFWFFPAQVNPKTAPVLVWLQGGPGGSSLYGLFVEHGPFSVDEHGNLVRRNITWNSRYSMLYIDNPVGTGFSFTGNDSGYANNEEDVARDLYSCLTQFFQIFTSYQSNDFYITGESYAGKYVPAISYKIHVENPTAKVKINFKGMAIGDGLSDPETMMPVYGEYLFYLGLLDENQRDDVTARGKEMAAYVREGRYQEAYKIFGTMLGVIGEETGLHQFYNYLITNNPKDFSYHPLFLARPETRNAIHVGNLTFHDGSEVSEHLSNDFMMSVKPWLATVMDNYKVMLYNGQLDIIVANPLTEAMLQTVDWRGLQAYKAAQRTVWKVNADDDEVAGYVRQVDNFYQVVVRDGGHILPHDQPARSFDMIRRFVENIPFSDLHQ